MHFRVARHTNDLNAIKSFYTMVLGFELLGDFKNHDNYNGIFLGFPDSDWHLEFTSSLEKANNQFGEDDILILYPETREKFDSLLKNISRNTILLVSSKNPYWNENGKMFLDPDGYRIVLSPLKITN